MEQPMQALDPNSEFEIAPDTNVVSLGEAASKVVRKVKQKMEAAVKPKRGRPKKVVADGPGHNAVALDGTRLRLAFVGNITAIDTDIGSLVGKRRALCKQAKADGIPVRSLLKAMKERGLGRDELIEKINEENESRELLSIPASPQMALEATIQDQKGREKLAEARGRADAYRNLTETHCPYSDPGTPEYQSWMVGFREASELFREACKPSVITKITAKPQKKD